MSISKKGLLAGVATATVALVATFVAPAAYAGTSAAACANVGSGYAVQKGKTVEVFTSVMARTSLATLLLLTDFTACTGIKSTGMVQTHSSHNFQSVLLGGTAPDLALDSTTRSHPSNGCNRSSCSSSSSSC